MGDNVKSKERESGPDQFDVLTLPQSVEHPLVNPIETAVTEDRDNVVRLQKRLARRSRRRARKRQAGRLPRLPRRPLRDRGALQRDLFEGRDLRDENAVGELEHFRQLLLENRAARCVRARFEDRQRRCPG